MYGTEVLANGKWEPRWKAPTIRVPCPSCKKIADRKPTAWWGFDQRKSFRLSCEPGLDIKQMKCHQTFDVVIDTTRPHNFEPGIETDLEHLTMD